jgi:hypothetical protein
MRKKDEKPTAEAEKARMAVREAFEAMMAYREEKSRDTGRTFYVPADANKKRPRGKR